MLLLRNRATRRFAAGRGWGHPSSGIDLPSLRFGENLERGLRPRKRQIAYRRTFLRRGVPTLTTELRQTALRETVSSTAIGQLRRSR